MFRFRIHRADRSRPAGAGSSRARCEPRCRDRAVVRATKRSQPAPADRRGRATMHAVPRDALPRDRRGRTPRRARARTIPARATRSASSVMPLRRRLLRRLGVPRLLLHRLLRLHQWLGLLLLLLRRCLIVALVASWRGRRGAALLAVLVTVCWFLHASRIRYIGAQCCGWTGKPAGWRVRIRRMVRIDRHRARRAREQRDRECGRSS